MVRTVLACVLVCLGLLAAAAPAAEPALGLKTDIEFARVGDVRLTLDAYTPAGPGPFPACILVHGGGFVRGDKQSYIKPLFEPLGKAGFAWFTIDYRLAPQHRWPACAEDVEAAIRWVKAHAADYRVDRDRIALIGESAGGHLVSYVGARATEDTRVAAVVSFYAPHDLEFQVRQRNALGESMTALLGVTELNDATWARLREASASTFVRRGMTPYLLIHGDADPQVPYEQSVRFQQQMQAKGNICDLISVPSGGHGMGSWDQLGSDYRERMIAWLQKTLPEPKKREEPPGGLPPAEGPALLPPEEAARTMIVPEGFRVTLFAGEPDVQQPIGFCIDDRGRLWVAEAYSYPIQTNQPNRDRILIFEDADGDGRFDRRTVFYEGLNYVTGIEVGFGGAWVMSPPSLYFIPDRNGDDVPDAAPQVVLDGFGNFDKNAHNLANGFAWGPDGWLYGTHGRTNWSMIGKPGTPDDQRVRFDGGVYRYHPVRDVWEPFADGTTNPWGIDWDDYGQGFVCNCVNPHLFHVIQGAHWEPWRNRESSRYAYERIASIADHLHFVGGGDIRAGIGSHDEDEAGGGHAHCGTMVYLGDNWPAQYRNTVFMNNIHGRRINNDILRRAGSGYTASHGRDVMVSQDPWYMGVTLQYGPDGGVYASDWSDTGECHSVRNTQRGTGRIYKITYGTPAVALVDPATLSDLELVALQLHRNDWHVRHARRLLQERAAAGRDLADAQRALHAMFAEQQDVTRKLRALWALHVIGGIDDAFLLAQLSHPSEYLRAWAIQLLCEDKSPPAVALDRFREMAAKDDSPFVRLYLASALQRLPLAQRWPIAEGLLARSEDADDANLPLMVWYAIEPLVEEDLVRFVALAEQAALPVVRRHIARRAASSEKSDAALAALVNVLRRTGHPEVAADVLQGTIQGLEGRRSAAMPDGWREAFAALQSSPHEAVQESAVQLALIFDDPTAMLALRSQAADPTVPAAARNRAVQALVAKKAPNLTPLLLDLLTHPATQRIALRGLAEYNDPATATTILDRYSSLDPEARQDALQTLTARRAWAAALLDAVEAGRVPRTDLSAFTVRQMQSLNDPQLAARLQSLWGEVRATPRDKARLIADYKRRLTPETLQRADRAAGRLVFQKTCANCHRLFDEGSAIGPEITGAQRTNLDYLLENIIDPSATVSKDFQMEVLETAAGRVVTGLILDESPTAVTVQTVNEKLVIPAAEIDVRTRSPLSLMPDGLLQPLTPTQVRDLIAYLSSPTQTPLPETQDKVGSALPE